MLGRRCFNVSRHRDWHRRPQDVITSPRKPPPKPPPTPPKTHPKTSSWKNDKILVRFSTRRLKLGDPTSPVARITPCLVCTLYITYVDILHHPEIDLKLSANITFFLQLSNWIQLPYTCRFPPFSDSPAAWWHGNFQSARLRRTLAIGWLAHRGVSPTEKQPIGKL